MSDAITKVDNRRSRRRQVLKTGQIILGFAGSTIDCLIVDETSQGVGIETAVMTDLPERLRLKIAGGAAFDAIRRWSIGSRVGVEFVGPKIPGDAASRQKKDVLMALKSQGAQAAALMLRDLDYFKDADLRTAMEEAEAAYQRLAAMLE